jgi:hypothetical protein
VAGWAYAGGHAQHATVCNGTSAIDLNSFLGARTVSAGWVLQTATGINDSGWIVRNAFNTLTGVTHAFELSITAVPEPESNALAITSLSLIGHVARKRRAKKA